MIYVISDIHGCYDRYMDMLAKISLGSEDTLYVLGDVIDRGPDGFKILLDMASRPNVVALRGNHEDMAIRALPCILRTICSEDEAILTEDEADAIELWFHNGGELSLADFLWLDEKQMQTAWDYMCAMPLYQEVEIGDRKFVLLHGGLENFSPDRALEDYAPDEILWCRPEPDTVYYPDKYVVFGHTPVQFLVDAKTPAKIYRQGNLIDIDCGCIYRGGKLGCLFGYYERVLCLKWMRGKTYRPSAVVGTGFYLFMLQIFTCEKRKSTFLWVEKRRIVRGIKRVVKSTFARLDLRK